jgi:hypothetical protein
MAGATRRAVTRIVAGVEDLVQRTGDGCTGQVLSGRMIGRSGDAVCSLHRAWGDEERTFLGWASKPRSTVCQWFSLKTTGMVSPGLASKSVATVSPGLASKPMASVFPVWASKPAAPVWWFGHQNHRDDFLLWTWKPMVGGQCRTRVEIRQLASPGSKSR